jgi:hypothetical protein
MVVVRAEYVLGRPFLKIFILFIAYIFEKVPVLFCHIPVLAGS